MRWTYMLLIAAVLFAILYFADAWSRLAPAQTTLPEPSASRAAHRIFAVGMLTGEFDEISLKFELPGRVRRVLVAAGAQVQAGQVLAELDSDDRDLQLQEAKAQLELARAEHELVRTGQRSPPSRGGANTTPASAEEMQAADARVRIAEAAVNYQRLLLSKTRLLAPTDGQVVHRELSPGDLTGPADMTDRLILAPRGRAVVRAYIEELDALDVQVGQRATVIVPARRDQELPGVVTACARELRPKPLRHNLPGERLDTRVREVTITLDQPPTLLNGLPVEVFITPQVEVERGRQRREAKHPRRSR